MSAALLPVPAKVPSLYQLEDDLVALADTAEGGIPDELRGEFEAALYEALATTKAKRDRVGEYLRHLEVQAAFAKSEAKRLADRARTFEAHRDRLKDYVQRTMELTGQTKLEGNTTTFKLRENPPHVEVEDAAVIPLEYKRHIPESWEPDKTAIAAALKAGAEIPGCDLVPGGARLEVR